jgi:general secretion pathway protein M
MSRWWNERTARERAIIALGASVLAAMLLFQGALKPLWALRASAEQSHAAAVAYLSDVEVAARAARTLKAAASTRSPLLDGGVRATAAATAQAAGLAIARLQPLNDGAVEFWLEDASSPQVFSWLVALSETYGIVVVKADLRRGSSDGKVRANVALSAAGGP